MDNTLAEGKSSIRIIYLGAFQGVGVFDKLISASVEVIGSFLPLAATCDSDLPFIRVSVEGCGPCPKLF